MSWHPIIAPDDGVAVYVDLISSPAAAQIARQPHLLTLAAELLASLKLKGETMSIEKDMGRVVGTTDVVETSDKDTILYAQPIKSELFARFVKNRPLASTSYVAFELRRIDATSYQLWSAHLGRTRPAMPEEEHETSQSRPFWDSHAIVWGNWPIKAQSITKDCPWQDVPVEQLS